VRGSSRRTWLTFHCTATSFLTEPAGRRAVVPGVDLDAVIEMHGAAAELVIAKRLQRQRAQAGPLLNEHGGDLALGGAVDAGVGPARPSDRDSTHV